MSQANIFDVLTVEFGSLKKLSELLNMTYNGVYMWKARNKGIPLRNVTKIEQLSGGRVTRQMLRPDKFQ